MYVCVFVQCKHMSLLYIIPLSRFPEFPPQFPYKAKAMFVFQECDGVDICIFGMHVQEYGSDCPPPNSRYILNILLYLVM